MGRFVQILSIVEAKDSLCWAMLKHDLGRDRSPDTRRPQQRRHAARLAARARGDRADCRPAAAPLARRRRGHRATPRRRRGADLGARHADLSRAGRAQPPLCALGARPEARQGSSGLPADAEPAGLYGDLARHHRGRRRRLAHQHATAWAGSCALHRRRGAEPRDRRRRMHRAVPLGTTFHAGRKSGRTAAAIIRVSIARSSAMRQRR